MAQNGPKMVVNQKFLENGSNDFPDFWPEVGGQYLKKVDLAGFFSKNPVLLDLGLTVPKRPKIAQNGPKMVVNQTFLENGSNDLPDFWPEVG